MVCTVTPRSVERRHVHVARRAGAEEHDVLERAALRDHVGRHVGMVVEADLVAVDQARQGGGVDRLGIDHDRRVVGPVDPGEDRVELVVAVDEDRFHGCPYPPGRYDMAKPAEMEGGHGGRISGQGRGHHRRQPRHRPRHRGGVRARGRADRDRLVLGRQSRRCRQGDRPGRGRSRSRSPATCASLPTASSSPPR